MKKLLALFLIFFIILATAVSAQITIGQGMVRSTPTTGPTRCVAGMADIYPCDQIHLLAHMSLADIGAEDGTILGNDHWGWTDPTTGHEYVIFGLTNGTAFVDITDREAPVYLGKLPSHGGESTWRDIKVYQDYAFITGDIPITNHGLQIFDLTQLRGITTTQTFTETVHYDGFGPGHNLWINAESGYLYVFRSDTCSGAIHMVNIQDPLNPTFAGCFAEIDAPLSDAECVNYNGPDSDYTGQEICFIGSDDNVSIGNVTDKNNPTLIKTFSYPGIVRAHQGALTPDQRYWLLSDTMDEPTNGHNTRTYVFDVADLDNPIVLGHYTHNTTARDHNVYIRDAAAYQTNWKAGFRMLDISMLPSLSFTETGYLDIAPASDSIAAQGAWSNYPWWRDGIVSVSGTDEGLFILGRTLPLNYSTFLGGALSDQGNSIAIDANGNIYVAGTTTSTIFPTATSYGQNTEHGVDAFVAKFDATGTAVYIIWVNAATLFAEDNGFGIDVDSAGNAYVTGQTNSSDFCAYFGAVPGYDQTYNGSGDAYLFKINPDGSQIDYCTYLGGNDWDTGRDVVVNAAGEAIVTGGTWSTDFPTTAGAPAENLTAQRDVFLARVSAAGTNLSFSTFLGGDGQEEARGVDLDIEGNALITGWTNSSNFPTTTRAWDQTYGGNFDAFLAKIDLDNSRLSYATYLGGSDEDRGYGLAVDPAGNSYITGNTISTNFPTTNNTFDSSHNGNYDGFVTKFNPTASDLVYSTFLGGSNADWSNGIDVDASGRAVISGETWSTNVPTTTLAFAPSISGSRDAFVMQFDYAGDKLLYGTYLGGTEWEIGTAVATDGAGNLYTTGKTNSRDFPTTTNAYDPIHNNEYDVFVSHLTIPDTSAFCTVPPTVSNVTISALGGGDIQLSWNVAGVDTYEVWRSNNAPYFIPPNTACNLDAACTLVENATMLTQAATGETLNNYSFVLRAITACQTVSTGLSNRTGEFDFPIVAGDPY